MGVEHQDQHSRLPRRSQLCRSCTQDRRGGGAGDRAEIAEITAGDVTTINQVARLMAWLQQHGCIMEKLDRKAIEKKLLDPELMPVVRRVLELRLGGAQAAVKKIDALLARAGDDDRIRGVSDITAQQRADGPAKDFSRKT